MSTPNYTRRDFLKMISLGATSLTLPGCTEVSRWFIGEPANNKPNIIFILADDLGYGDLGCYGQKRIKTPHIDRLATEGMRFTQCYAGSTVCAPSRSVLMTGQHTGHTRIRGNMGKAGGVLVLDNGPPQRRVPLKPEDITVAEVLKQADYVTGITGKWGLGEPGTTGVPNQQGFDEWFGYLNQRRAHNYYPTYLWHNEQKLILKANKSGKQQYSHDLFTRFAMDFIRNHKNKPFFLYLAYTIPHGRYEIPSIEPYTDKPWPDDAKIYAAMITRMDTDIGRIVELLKELAIDNNTIIFFCSDNGAANRWEGLFDSCGPLRGCKRHLYEGGIRTPMIVRWPGRVPAGKVSDVVWYYADVLPTLAELAGVKAPANIDGVSVLPTLLGEKQNLKDRFLYWEFFGQGFQQAVRWGKWKVVRLGTPTAKKTPMGTLTPDKTLELYNLDEDIAEKHNVAAQHPEIIARIETYLKTARTESPNWPLEAKN